MKTSRKVIAALSVLVLILLVTNNTNRKNMIVYGAMKCPWTVKQLDYLNEKGISHVFVDCSSRKCPDFVDGFPTTQTRDGKILNGFTKI